MPFMEWKKDLETGIETFDAHHRQLVHLLNELYEGVFNCTELSQEQSLTEHTLRELSNYVHYHLEAEERVMQDYNYPGLADQKKQHKNFINRVAQLNEQHQAGVAALSLETFQFLRDWLAGHIAGSDKQYAQFFHDKGIE